MVYERIDPLKDENVMKLSRFGHIKRYQKATSYIAKTDSVFDVGCGYGYGSKMMAQKAKKIIAIDISSAAIKYAKKKYNHKKIKYMTGDLEKLNLSNLGSFDIITCFEVLEHLHKPEIVLKKIRKLISPKGYLFLSLPNGKNAPENNPHHIKNYTQKDIKNLLHKSGFRIEEVFGQYPLLGSLAGMMKKITGRDSDTDMKQSFTAKLVDSIPLISKIFSGLFRGKLMVSTARVLYFVVKPK